MSFISIQESREEQIRTVSPGPGLSRQNSNLVDDDTTIFHYRSKSVERLDSPDNGTPNRMDSLPYADEQEVESELSLVPEERHKLARLAASQSLPTNKNFVVKLLNDLFKRSEFDQASYGNLKAKSMENLLAIQSGLTLLSPAPLWDTHPETASRKKQFEVVRHELKQGLLKRFNKTDRPSTSRKPLTHPSSENLVVNQDIHFESSLNLTDELRQVLERNLSKALEDSIESKIKSSLKSKSIETVKKQKSKKKRKVQIYDSNRTVNKSPPSTDTDSEQGTDSSKNSDTEEKSTQTKEKQD